MTTANTAELPTAGLAGIPGVRPARELVPGPRRPLDDDVLPVHDDLAELLPVHGLRRGTVVSVHGSATLVWLLLVEALRVDSFAALVGLPDLGILAGLALGIPAERLIVIPDPGPDLATVLGTLLDGVDLIATDPAGLPPAAARRLAHRARHRRGILLPTTTRPDARIDAWPGADLCVRATEIRWTGIDRGAGYLADQHIELTVTGRAAAARPVTGNITLPWANLTSVT